MMEKEQILLTVPMCKMKTLTGERFYTLIITDKRIVAGKVGKSYVRGDKILGAVVQKFEKSRMDADKYEGMEVEEIVHTGKDNFAFAYDELKEIVIKKVMFGNYFLQLKPHKGKQVHFQPDKALAPVQEILLKQAPDIVKTK